MTQHLPPLRVVSLLPSATELVWEVLKAARAEGTVAPRDLPVLVGSKGVAGICRIFDLIKRFSLITHHVPMLQGHMNATTQKNINIYQR